LNEPSQGYRLLASKTGGSRTCDPGEIFVDAPGGTDDGIFYGAWCAIEGYNHTDYIGLDIQGTMGASDGVSSPGIAVPVLSQYQNAVMRTTFSAWVALTGQPYYEIPPYPDSMTHVRADLYGHHIVTAGFDEVPELVGEWILELYERIPVSGGGGTPEVPEDTPCPPRLPWPYVDAIPVPPRITSESARVRRSNP